jgi:hypothetical protein
MIRTSASDSVFDHKKEIKSKLLSSLASVIQFESGFYFVSKQSVFMTKVAGRFFGLQQIIKIETLLKYS